MIQEGKIGSIFINKDGYTFHKEEVFNTNRVSLFNSPTNRVEKIAFINSNTEDEDPLHIKKYFKIYDVKGVGIFKEGL